MDQPARSVPASATTQADLLNLVGLLETAALLTCPPNADRDPRGLVPAVARRRAGPLSNSPSRPDGTGVPSGPVNPPCSGR
jgi:hypothetical protein